jgi:phage head maturation protease
MRKTGLWLGAKIVDDSAWKKVKEGVYKGFSIGGKKLKVVPDFDVNLNKAITRIKEYLLTEISLVDRPANPLATFSFIKRNVNSSEVEDMDDITKDVASKEESLEKTASTEEVKTDSEAPVA